MRGEKTVAVAGVADDDVARLCLLLRRVLPRLDARWRWGVESRADLVIADPSSFLGWMAMTRAIASGVRCAVIDASTEHHADYVFARPFDAQQLESALNSVSRESARPAGVQPHLYDFYYEEMGVGAHARKSHSNAESAAVGFDEYLRSHPDRNAGLQQITLPQIGSLRQPLLAAHIEPPSDAAAWRLEPSRRSRGALSLVHSRHDDEQTAHTLWAYLTGDLLQSPRQLQRPDLPTLVLDPVNRTFHSEALLRQLQAHCDTSTPLSQWRPLTLAQLDRVRRETPAQPYNKLLWLDALTHADSQLAVHLDPGGSYRLSRWLDIDDSLPRQQRIATAMVRARTLPEISEISRVSMADVFDAVSAFDAIDQIEWTRRPARHGQPAGDGARISSLVSRLRNLIDIHGRENIGLGLTG